MQGEAYMGTKLPRGIFHAQDEGWVDIDVLTLGDMNLASSGMCWCQLMVLLKSALAHVS